MDRWRTLAEESRHLADCAGRSVPIRRELQKVADLANTLRQRVHGSNFSQEELAATRLLARGGIEASGFTTPSKRPRETGIQVVGGREAREGREHVEAGHHRKVLVSFDPSLEDGQVKARRSIQTLLDRVQEESKNKRYQPEVERRQATHPFPEHTTHSWTYPGAVPPNSENGLASEGGGGSGARKLDYFAVGASGMIGVSDLPAKDQAYVDVVLRMVESRSGGTAFDAMTEFVEAASSAVGADESVVACWKALQFMVREIGCDYFPDDEGPSHQNVGKLLLTGARKFLESRNDRGMAKMVQESRDVILIGGNPDKLHEIQNFIIFKHHKAGKLDVRDGPEGLNTAWVQVYYALRTGHLREALIASTRAQWLLAGQRMKPLQAYVDEWINRDGDLSLESVDGILGACRDLLNNPTSGRRTPFFKYKVLTLSFLSGSIDHVDQLSTMVGKVWENLDEYLWFSVACTRASSEAGVFNLQKLQKRIRNFSSNYYSREGRSPMLYALVLLASLQFKTAVSFLAQDSMSEKHRSDAVHYALALKHHNILDAGSSGDTGSSATRVDFGMFVESFGHQFVRSDSFLALDYYLLAVELHAGRHNLKMMSQALRKALVESGDTRRLLSNEAGFPAGHPIKEFLGEDDCNRVLQLAAQDCEKFSENDQAYAIYMAAKSNVKALGIVNIQIALVLKNWAWGGQQGADHLESIYAELLSLARRGQEAIALMNGGLIGCPQCNGFRALESIASMFRSFFSERFSDATHAAQGLDFLPAEPSLARDKAERLRSCDISLVHILPAVLLIYARAVVKQYEENPACPSPTLQIEALAALGKTVPPPFVVGKDVYRELTALLGRLT